MANGIQLIAAERKRQIAKEGWSAKHDDAHMAGEIAMAAACYVLPHHVRSNAPLGTNGTFFARFWPWDIKWWKPTPEIRERELVKVGALIAAEIDRLQRQAARSSR